MHTLAIVTVCLAAAAAGDNGETKPVPLNIAVPEARYESGAFIDAITEAGGGVDFVFGDERPFPECHASTLVETAEGELLCAWFGGTKEKDPDVGIWMSRHANGAWSPPERVAKITEQAHWNPVLFRDPAAPTVYLFFKEGPEIPTWRTFWMRSDDHGRTWSEARELVPGDAGGRGPVRCKPIVLSDGAWLAGASTESGPWLPFADRSGDQGMTWTRSEDFAFDPAALRGRGAIQPTLWESAPGQAHALMRTTGGKVWRADSEDGGRTWGPMRETSLPNNNSGVDVLRMQDGTLFLLYNPVGMSWGPRTPMDLAVSHDNGETWETFARLDHEPVSGVEFSYPAIVATQDGIAVSYTWHRERIRVWRIPHAVLERAAPKDGGGN